MMTSPRSRIPLRPRTPLRSRTRFALAVLAAGAIGACQPPSDDEGADPIELIESFEAAVEAMQTAAADHGAAVTAAADSDAVAAEEADFAADHAETFEAAHHAAEDLAMCSGMDDAAAQTPEGVVAMLEELEAAFQAHEGEMSAAAEVDRAGIEDAFQAEVELHAGHALELHDDMHEHAEAGELTCEGHGDGMEM